MLRLIEVTCKNKTEAEAIIGVLLKKRLIACANYWPITSVYRWQGKIERASEVMVLVKTSKKLSVAVTKEIKRLHSYDVPVIIAYSAGSDKQVDQWITNETC